MNGHGTPISEQFSCYQALVSGSAGSHENYGTSPDGFLALLPAPGPKRVEERGVGHEPCLNSSLGFLRRSPSARRIPFDLRFTPVEDPSGIPEAKRPPRSLGSASFPLSLSAAKPPARCRLIGFTPLNEPHTESHESIRFLGPRLVKAKEVAPCALFYKRSDVFVSMEMKSQNVLSYCDQHYSHLHLGDEGDEDFESSLASPPAPLFAPVSQSHDDQPDWARLAGLSVGVDLGHIGSETQDLVCPPSTRSGLTTMPHSAEPESILTFLPDEFATEFEESDSSFGADYGGRNHTDPARRCRGSSSTTESLHLSASGNDSCGISSTLWDATTTASTRSSSPASSLYSNISSSCQHPPLTSSLFSHRSWQSSCASKSTDVAGGCTALQPSLRGGAYGAFHKSRVTRSAGTAAEGYSDFLEAHEDRGALADDEENEQDSASSQQLESDDSQKFDKPCSTCRRPSFPLQKRQIRAMSAPSREKPKRALI